MTEEKHLRVGSLLAPDVPLKEAGIPRSSDSLVLRRKDVFPGCGEFEVRHLDGAPVLAVSSPWWPRPGGPWGTEVGGGLVTGGGVSGTDPRGPECLGSGSESHGART